MHLKTKKKLIRALLAIRTQALYSLCYTHVTFHPISHFLPDDKSWASQQIQSITQNHRSPTSGIANTLVYFKFVNCDSLRSYQFYFILDVFSLISLG